MKVNVFMDYHDCNPKNSSLEEVACIIQTDTSVKDRTDKHRYYLCQNLIQAATNEKQSCMCFSVATLFEGGKTQKHVIGWSGIGMVDFDDLDETLIDQLAEKAQQDEHTLMTYKTISGKGLRILFIYPVDADSMPKGGIWSSNVPVKKFELHVKLQEKNFAIIDANRFFATLRMTTGGQVGQVSIGIF